MIRFANQEDNQKLLELTSRNPMKGNISLRIDRNPNFFSLLHLRGDSKTIVYENDQQIIGCISVSKSHYYVNGLNEPVWYISDFKVDQLHRNTRVAYHLTRYCAEYLKSEKADLLFCTAAKGNDRVMSFFSGRMGLPLFVKAADFKVMQLLPKISTRKNPNIKISDHLDHLGMDLVRDAYRKYQLGKSGWTTDRANRTFFTYIEGEEVVAVIAVFDTSSMKQNVVMDASPALKMVLKSMGLMYDLTGFYPFPRVGEAIRISYLDVCCCRPGYHDQLKALIQEARHWTYKGKKHFLSIGLDCLCHFRNSIGLILGNNPFFDRAIDHFTITRTNLRKTIFFNVSLDLA